jgi:hypothetical protein
VCELRLDPIVDVAVRLILVGILFCSQQPVREANLGERFALEHHRIVSWVTLKDLGKHRRGRAATMTPAP